MFLPAFSNTLSSYGVSGTSWIMRLMLVSSLPNALVATQVKRAESALSDLLMLIVDRTPSVTISSRTVYLKVIQNQPNSQEKYRFNTLGQPQRQVSCYSCSIRFQLVFLLQLHMRGRYSRLSKQFEFGFLFQLMEELQKQIKEIRFLR